MRYVWPSGSHIPHCPPHVAWKSAPIASSPPAALSVSSQFETRSSSCVRWCEWIAAPSTPPGTPTAPPGRPLLPATIVAIRDDGWSRAIRQPIVDVPVGSTTTSHDAGDARLTRPV